MSRLSKEYSFCNEASTSQEGLEEEALTAASNRTLKVAVQLESSSESRPISKEKDKRPLPLFNNQPSKRPRGELIDHGVSPGSVSCLSSSVEQVPLPSSMTIQSHEGNEYQRRHIQSFPRQLPSSVEYNQLPSAVASQSYEGYNNNRSHTHNFCRQDMPPSSVGYNQLPFTEATQTYQIVIKEGRPSDRELDELAGKIGAKWETLGIHLGIGQDVLEGIAANAKDKPHQMLLRWINTTTSAAPFGELYHALCHVRVGFNNIAKEFCCPSGYGRPPSSVEHNHLPVVPVTQSSTLTYQTSHRQIAKSFSGHDMPPSSVECSQLPFTGVTQTYQGFPGWLPSSVQYNQFPSTAASQNYEGYSNWRGHTHSFSGHDMPPSSMGYNQLPFAVATQTYQSSPSGYGRPPLTMEYNHIFYPGTTTQAYGEATYQGMHPPSTVTHNEQIHQRRFTHRSFGHGLPPSSVRCNQLSFVAATPAHDEPSIWKSHTQPSPSSYGRLPSSVEHNQLPVAQVTQSSTLTYQTSHPQSFPGWLLPSSVEYNQFPSTVVSETGEGYNNSRGHTQSVFGHDVPPSSVGYSQVPFTAATQSYQPSHALAVVVKILEAEYERRSQLKPLLWESTIKLPLEDVYTRLKIVSRRKRDFQLQTDEVSMEGIFEENDDVVVLVEGSPGIGKTTFCLKIAYEWAKQQIPKGHSFPECAVLLLLKCRDIDGDIMDAIVEQLLPERMDETVKKEFVDFIEDFRYQEKVLIILDGLDELPKKSESHIDQLLRKKILPFCYVLVTSRQERGIAVRQKVDFDILLQIQGFTEEDAFEYIRKHFRYAGPEHLATGERLITQIKENTFLHALPSNPLNLLLLCVVFEDYQGELPSFRTELYQIIIRCLLRRYCAKHKLEAPCDDQALEKQFEDSLLVLGELAWRCLLEGQFSFREEELAKFESKIKDLAARKLGLVSKEGSVKKINPQHEYHFFHKTFQEYLAATYLARKLLKKELNLFVDLKLVLFEITVKYRQVFLFVSGILGMDASVLFKQIGEHLAGSWVWLKCSEEEATFFTESFSESQNAEQMAMTLCSFIPFPLTLELTILDRDMYDFPETANILIVAEACRNFPQLQHPVHLTIQIVNIFLDDEVVAKKFLVSCPKLQTFSFRILSLRETLHSVTAVFEGLSGNSTIRSFTLRGQPDLSSDEAVIIGNSLAANKTLTTVTFELINECGEAWASALERGLSADTPLTSVVLKIYGLLSAEAMGGLKKVLSNRSLASLTLIIYGEMQDSLASSLGKTLRAESILKSLTLIIYGKVSYSGADSLERGFLENSALNSLEVKVFGELPDNWVTVAEKVLEAKKSKTSVAFHPNITGTISKEQVTGLCPGFELESLTLNLWGELSCTGANTLCNLLTTSSTSCIILNIHGKVTGNVAECLVSYLKPCKTRSSFSINIWGELTRGGSSALRELEYNGKYSFALNVCSVAPDPWICNDLNDTTNVSSSITSVYTEVEHNCARSQHLNISNQDFFGLDRACNLGDGLAKNTSLTTLSLTFNTCKYMRVDWARGLGDGLAKNTSLTTLSLTFSNCSDLSGDWTRGLGDGLAKNTSLTTLSLTFSNCRDLVEDWTNSLGDGLGKNSSLTTLSLTIDNCSDLSEAWALVLGDGLAKNTSLTSLSLTFSNCRDLVEGWTNSLGDGLAKNTSLTTLSLTVNNCGELSGGDACSLAENLAKNTSLTTLSLTYNNYCSRSECWAYGLGDGLANNTSLTTLSLTINNYNVLMEDWANGLWGGLANNTSLILLSLTINDYSDVGKDGVLSVGDCLANNTSLTTLSLTFNSYAYLNGYFTHGLGDGLANNTSLTTLSLTINNYSNMCEDWAWDLGGGLAKNTSLTTLSLTVNNYSYLVGDLIDGSGESLANNTSLTTLSLAVNNYGDLGGYWARGLGDGLAKNTSLTTLSLTFNDYSDLSGDWARGLGDSIGRSKSLTVVNVTVTSAYIKESEELLCGLCNSLAESDTITALNITFNDHSGTSEVVGHDLRKLFADCKSSPSLNLTVNLYGEAVVS